MFAAADTGYRPASYECSRDEGGVLLGLHLPGHDPSDEDAWSAAAAIWPEEGNDFDEEYGRDDRLPRFGFETPRRVWVRQIPIEDGDEDAPEEFWGGFLWHYDDSSQHDGAPITLVEPRDTFRHRCAACGDRALVGHPRSKDYVNDIEIDDSELVHPTSDVKHVWLCRAHSQVVNDFSRAKQAACGAPCVDCGHAAGGHERTDARTCWGADPFGSKPIACDCTAPSPHSMTLTLDDVRAGAA